LRSLLAVRLARLHGVPVELLSGGKAKRRTDRRDVATFLGKKICPAGVSIRAVEAEALPWGLFKE